MLNERKNIEIMSPAGSFESLMAAINAGAGSVYFGAGNLNMRAKSSNNFSIDDIKEIAARCNARSVKSYLTLNTVMYDKDIVKMKKMIDTAKSSNITAVIASDFSVINYAIQQGVEVHMSTQCNVSNIEAVKFYSKFADVIVLARELNLKQVAGITKAIREENICGPSAELIKIEIFIHGALCMAVSGKCYLSLHEKNTSANRGACLQTCRKAYNVTEHESGNELEIDNEYIMSPKDLCTVGFLDEIIGAGVSILKIEGRGRSPEYVKRVTECYHEAIDAFFEADYTDEKIKLWKERLSSVFNRGFWDGYYLGQKLGEWSKQYGSQASKRKVHVGKATNYFKKLGVAEFQMQSNDLKIGDDVLITGPTTGAIELKVEEMRLDTGKVIEVRKGDIFSVKVDSLIRRNDKLYKIVNANEVPAQ